MTTDNELIITTKEQRDEVLKQAELTREQGNLEEALTTLGKVKDWDEQNQPQNPKRCAVHGHIRITYSRMALYEQSPENKKEFLRLGKEVAVEGLNLLNDFPNETGLLAIMQIHVASASSELSDLSEGQEKTTELQQALETVEKAIQNLPGSQAHKAWPLRLKTEILRKMQNFEQATKTCFYGLELIFAGYQEELANDLQSGELKLRVWMCGLQLQLALIAKDQNMPILAKHYATTVLATTDDSGALTERKKEAQQIVDSLL